MSIRLEWTEAEHAAPVVLRAGRYAADGNQVTYPMALLIGSSVIEGTRDELLAVVARATQLLEAEQ